MAQIKLLKQIQQCDEFNTFVILNGNYIQAFQK